MRKRAIKSFEINKGLVLKRYINDRSKYSNSEEFVKDRLKKGYSNVVRFVFITLSIVGILLIAFGIFILKYPSIISC